MALEANYVANNISTYMPDRGNAIAYIAWGTFGNVFPSWAWGLLMATKDGANFIGIDNANHKICAAYYDGNSWRKITSITT